MEKLICILSSPCTEPISDELRIHISKGNFHILRKMYKKIQLWVRKWFPKYYANSNVDKFNYTKTLNFCSREASPNEFKTWGTHQEKIFATYKANCKWASGIYNGSQWINTIKVFTKKEWTKMIIHKMGITTKNWKIAQLTSCKYILQVLCNKITHPM